MQRNVSRRNLLASGVAATSLALPASIATAQAAKPSQKKQGNAIAVSTYSYWRYRPDSKLTIEQCIELAGEAGFDAVEILHVQMEDQSNPTLQRIKQKAFRLKYK